ncbi:MAG: ATP-binding protein [Luminiphilus sp.]|nr:ATP-binding protein [Luminiphilus sp.]
MSCWGGFISSAVSRILAFQRKLLLSLETQASYNATLVEQAAACMLVVDNHYLLRDANADAQALLIADNTSHWHRPLSELLPPGPGIERLLESLKTTLRGQPVTNLEIQMTGNDGQHLDFVWNMAPHRNAQGDAIGIICVGQDITALKRVQQQVMHSSRLTTLGEMTTSIAHEINQPLAIIRLLAQNLLKKISFAIAKEEPVDSEFIQSKLKRIDQQIERAAVITDHMRLFGHSEQGPQAQVIVQSVIAGALSLTAEQYRLQNIDLIYEKPDEDIIITGKKLELEQVILNVLSNAEYAVNKYNPSGHKRIRISLYSDTIGSKIEISDSGAGIDDHTLPHIFDPFYTTKETGEGTGLGLSVTYKLLTDMGASISATNSPDGGATFTIEFARAKA